MLRVSGMVGARQTLCTCDFWGDEKKWCCFGWWWWVVEFVNQYKCSTLVQPTLLALDSDWDQAEQLDDLASFAWACHFQPLCTFYNNLLRHSLFNSTSTTLSDTKPLILRRIKDISYAYSHIWIPYFSFLVKCGILRSWLLKCSSQISLRV